MSHFIVNILFGNICKSQNIFSLCYHYTCSVSECKQWAKYQTQHGAKFWSFDGCGCVCYAKSGCNSIYHFLHFLLRTVAQKTAVSLNFLAGMMNGDCGSSQWGEIGHARGFEGQMIHGEDINC